MKFLPAVAILCLFAVSCAPAPAPQKNKVPRSRRTQRPKIEPQSTGPSNLLRLHTTPQTSTASSLFTMSRSFECLRTHPLQKDSAGCASRWKKLSR